MTLSAGRRAEGQGVRRTRRRRDRPTGRGPGRRAPRSCRPQGSSEAQARSAGPSPPRPAMRPGAARASMARASASNSAAIARSAVTAGSLWVLRCRARRRHCSAFVRKYAASFTIPISTKAIHSPAHEVALTHAADIITIKRTKTAELSLQNYVFCHFSSAAQADHRRDDLTHAANARRDCAVLGRGCGPATRPRGLRPPGSPSGPAPPAPRRCGP